MEATGCFLRQIGKEPEEYAGTTYWNANVVSLQDHIYVVSHRAILTLVTTSGCNASCSFCSNEITFTPSGPYLTFNDRLARVKALALLAKVKKVAFTGGEPTASPQRLYDLVRQMAPGFKTTRVHTNGFGLFHNVETLSGEKPLIYALREANLTGISVSVANFDTQINRRIMRFKGRWQGLDESTLQRIATACNQLGLSARLSCVLTQEGIRDVEGIFAYIDWGRGLGFRRFIFRSPSKIEDKYSKQTDYTTYNRENHIDIHNLTPILEQTPGWTEKFSEHKSDSHVHVYTLDGEIVVDLDESAEEEDPDSKIRRLIVMPNGIAYTSWIDPLSHLFADDRERSYIDATRELPKLIQPLRAGASSFS